MKTTEKIIFKSLFKPEKIDCEWYNICANNNKN